MKLGFYLEPKWLPDVGAWMVWGSLILNVSEQNGEMAQLFLLCSCLTCVVLSVQCVCVWAISFQNREPVRYALESHCKEINVNVCVFMVRGVSMLFQEPWKLGHCNFFPFLWSSYGRGWCQCASSISISKMLKPLLSSGLAWWLIG